MCGVVPAILARETLRSPVASLSPWHASGIEPSLRHRNVSSFHPSPGRLRSPRHPIDKGRSCPSHPDQPCAVWMPPSRRRWTRSGAIARPEPTRTDWPLRRQSRERSCSPDTPMTTSWRRLRRDQGRDLPRCPSLDPTHRPGELHTPWNPDQLDASWMRHRLAAGPRDGNATAP